MVGLGNVDNISDLNKPVSNATQTALNLKAPINNPQFTGTISSNKFLVDATGNLTAFSLTSNNNLTCTDVIFAGGTSLTSTIGNLATLSGPTFTGTLSIKNGTTSVFSVDNYANLTCNGIGSIAIMNGATANFYVDYPGNMTTQGLILANGGISTPSLILNGTSLPSQFASKSRGSITATTTFQTVYTLTSGTQGTITAVSGTGAYPCMMSAFFQWTNGTTYPSLTQIASSGNAVQSGISPTNVGNGTQFIALQITSTGTPLIQLKTTTSSFTVRWYVTLL